ncbi:pantothenate kinase [Oscillatoria sp. FACHB-1407]|uniref:pantothenate kinase n=1 Tax=Oscillatoria sp. FACHB-1407 TaxID=2692847 RepID=UPI001683C03C|nr:pantothenate kinase [Oscillatoria sp. FACHB-1407]MBD2465141.1 pantothenate kinase [Oscillatoria sp. FACHB-1407]
MTGDRSSWVALMIGNSRLHWAIFTDQTLRYAWDTPHFSPEVAAHLLDAQFALEALAQVSLIHLPDSLHLHAPDLWIASVVPDQTLLWQAYSRAYGLTLTDVPLQSLYPTLGIDRALALWGAIAQWGTPTLVIDGGTALTFTGADEQHQLVGGAILPGLQLQLRSLSQHTAALPAVTTPLPDLPTRWATNTPDAIRSGVLYTTLAGIREFIKDWLKAFPTSAIALTGGDGEWLYQACHTQYPNLATHFYWDSHLVLKGIAATRMSRELKESR